MAKKKDKKKKPTQKKVASKPPIQKTVPRLKLESGFWNKNKIPALLLFILSIGIYLPSINYDYVLDDKIVLNENGLIKKGFSGIWKILTTESMTGYFGEERQLVAGGRYRPLSLVTFAIEHQLLGNSYHRIEDRWIKEMRKIPDLSDKMDYVSNNTRLKNVMFDSEENFINALQGIIPIALINKHKATILEASAIAHPRWSHLVNVLLFGFTCLLLFRVLSIIFPIKNKEWYLTLPFVASLLFALHPIHLEVVANVKGRDEVLALLGSLAAMYYTLKYVIEEKMQYLIYSGIILFLAMMAKENAITFLAIMPLTIYFFSNVDFKKNAMSAIPLVVAAVAFLVMRGSSLDSSLISAISGDESSDLMNNPFYGMTGSEKFATIFYTLGQYVKLLFFPHPLTHDYYPYQVPIMNWGNLGSIFSLVLYLGMGGFAIYGLRKKSIIAYGILFFLIPLSIVSNIAFPIGTFMNERFIYFSSIGFCIILAYFISRKLPAPILNLSVFVIFVLGFGVKSITHLPVWENGYTLNRNAIKYSPNSARANCFMGTALFDKFYRGETDPVKKQELLNEITGYIDRSLEIYPRYGSALTMKSGVAAEHYKVDYDLPKLLASFEMILRVKKSDSFITTYLNYLEGKDEERLSNFYHRIGYEYHYKQRRDPQTALYYLDMGRKFMPNNALLIQDISDVQNQN